MPKTSLRAKKARCRKLWYDAKVENPKRSLISIYDDLIVKEARGGKVVLDSPEQVWGENEIPSESTFTKWARTWPPIKEPEPGLIVKPWDENWGNDPVRIRTLSVLFDLACDIYQRQGLTEDGFEGFTKSVCDWACKLSAFFDLENRNECLVLIYFAYVFAKDEQYAEAFEEPMTFQYESSKMLMRWHKRHQDPDLTEKLREKEGVVVIPLWEQEDWSLAEAVVARHLLPMAWIMPPIVLEPRIPAADLETTPQEQSSDLAPNKLLDELRAQGLPIDEDHASLGMVYTNPQEREVEKG